MADISKLSIGGTQYNIKDSTARSGVSTNATAISNLSDDTLSYSKSINNGDLVNVTNNDVQFSLYSGKEWELLFQIPAATTEKAGVLTAADKAKINKIDTITSDIAGGMHFIGTTSTKLTDGATTAELTAASINSLTKTKSFIAGDLVIYNKKEFVWNGGTWTEFGDLSSLGSLAYKNSASGTLPSSSHNHSFTGTAHSHTITVSGGGVSGSCTPRGSVSIRDSALVTGSFMKVYYNPTSPSDVSTQYLVSQDQLSTTTLRGVSGTTTITPFGSPGTLPTGNTVVKTVSGNSSSISVANETLTIPASVLTGVTTTTVNALSSQGTLPSGGTGVTVARADSSSTTVATYTARTTDSNDTTNYKWKDLPACLSGLFTGNLTTLSLTHTNPTVTISDATATGTISSNNAYAANSSVTVS